MSTELSPENELFITEQIAAGMFRNRNEALDAGIELLKQRKSFLDGVDEGRRQLDAGEFTEYDDDSLRALFAELKDRAARFGSRARIGE